MELQISTIIKITLGVIVIVFIVVAISSIYSNYIEPFFSEEEEPPIDFQVDDLDDDGLKAITDVGSFASTDRGVIIYNGKETDLYFKGDVLIVEVRKWSHWAKLVKKKIVIGSRKFEKDKPYGQIHINPNYLDQRDLPDHQLIKRLNNAIIIGNEIYQK